MIQSIYFSRMPDHLKPARAPGGGASNRGLRLSERDTTGVYAKAREAEQFFKRRVLPRIEAARRRGDMVRFLNGVWSINGQPLKV